MCNFQTTREKKGTERKPDHSIEDKKRGKKQKNMEKQK